MIRIETLSKTYGGSVALSQIDLVVGRGEILGLLGTNGAGRTTLLNILATLVRPTSGRVEVGGIDALKHPFKVRPRVGYLAQSPGFYEELTAREMLEFVASSRKLHAKAATSAIENVLRDIELDSGRPIRELSPGLRQRLALAAAVLPEPQLLLLDEPQNNLDPVAQRHLRDQLKRIQGKGTTIVMASSALDGLQTVAERVVFLHRGEILGEWRAVDGRTDLLKAWEALWQDQESREAEARSAVRQQ